MPGHHGLGSYDDQGTLLILPTLGEQNPKETIGLSPSGSRAVPLKHRELLAEGQVLQSNFPNIAGQNKKANQRTKQRKHEVQREGQRVGKATVSGRTEFLARHSLGFSFRSNFCGGPRRKARGQTTCPGSPN